MRVSGLNPKPLSAFRTTASYTNPPPLTTTPTTCQSGPSSGWREELREMFGGLGVQRAKLVGIRLSGF